MRLDGWNLARWLALGGLAILAVVSAAFLVATVRVRLRRARRPRPAEGQAQRPVRRIGPNGSTIGECVAGTALGAVLGAVECLAFVGFRHGWTFNLAVGLLLGGVIGYLGTIGRLRSAIILPAFLIPISIKCSESVDGGAAGAPFGLLLGLVFGLWMDWAGKSRRATSKALKASPPEDGD